jgi:outer membrane cobalamin receptor
LLSAKPVSTFADRALARDAITPSKTVFVRVENLFNKRYEEVFSYRSPPFAIYAGLKVRLGAE